MVIRARNFSQTMADGYQSRNVSQTMVLMVIRVRIALVKLWRMVIRACHFSQNMVLMVIRAYSFSQITVDGYQIL